MSKEKSNFKWYDWVHVSFQLIMILCCWLMTSLSIWSLTDERFMHSPSSWVKSTFITGVVIWMTYVYFKYVFVIKLKRIKK